MTKEEAKKLTTALDTVFLYGGIQGEHHARWVLDQLVREVSDLVHPGGYLGFLSDFNAPDYSPWDPGIAP